MSRRRKDEEAQEEAESELEVLIDSPVTVKPKESDEIVQFKTVWGVARNQEMLVRAENGDYRLIPFWVTRQKNEMSKQEYESYPTPKGQLPVFSNHFPSDMEITDYVFRLGITEGVFTPAEEEEVARFVARIFLTKWRGV